MADPTDQPDQLADAQIASLGPNMDSPVDPYNDPAIYEAYQQTSQDFQLKNGLNSMHKLMANLLALGFKQTEVAQRLENIYGRRIYPNYISRLTKVPLFADYLANLQNQLGEKIGRSIIQPQFQARAPKMMEIIDELLEGQFEDEKRARLQLDTVRFATEQGFGRATQRTENITPPLDPYKESLDIDQKLAELEKEVSRLAKRSTPTTIDVTPTTNTNPGDSK